MLDQNDPHPCVGTLPTHTNAGSKCHLPSVGTLPAPTNGLHFMFKMGYTFVGRHPTLQQGLLEYCLHLATNFLFLFNSENVIVENHTCEANLTCENTSPGQQKLLS